MNKISGKELNLLKTLEILKSNRFVSFYHFNNLSKREWDTIKQKLRKIETQGIPSNEKSTQLLCTGDKERKGKTQVLPLLKDLNTRTNLLLERTAQKLYVQSNLKQVPTKNKGVTAKRKLKGAEVELLVLKSKAVVKALYPFLFSSQSCQGVEQTVDTFPLPLRAVRAKHFVQSKTSTHVQSVAERFSHKQVVLNVSDSLLPEKSAKHNHACSARTGLYLNPVRAEHARINSLINASYLIEGPTLLVGASTIEGFKESAKQLEKEKGLVFVGGLLENQFINHLDLKDCLKTSCQATTSANLLQTLNYALMIPPLSYYSNKLLFLLQKRQESLKKEEL